MPQPAKHCPSIAEHAAPQMPEQCSSNAPRNAHTYPHTHEHLLTWLSYLTLRNARTGVQRNRSIGGVRARQADAARGRNAVTCHD